MPASKSTSIDRGSEQRSHFQYSALCQVYLLVVARIDSAVGVRRLSLGWGFTPSVRLLLAEPAQLLLRAPGRAGVVVHGPSCSWGAR